MKIIVLAGGKSERLKPFYEKPLIPICGKKVIRHQLEILYEAGGRDFLIIGNGNNLDEIKTEGVEFLKQFSESRLEYAEQNINEGSAGALKSSEFLKKIMTGELSDTDAIIVSSNDILESTAYINLLQVREKNPGKIVVLGQKVDKYFPGGYLLIDQKGNLQKIVEKPEPGKEPSDLINIFVHYHPSLAVLMRELENIEKTDLDTYFSALFKLIEKGNEVKVAKYEGKWQAIKYPWHILEAAKLLLEREIAIRKRLVAEDVEIGENVKIKGDVVMESGVKIFDNVIITGPTYIGVGSVVAENSTVKQSYIGSKCVIGSGSEINRCYLGIGSWTHRNYLGDSVIGNNVSFGGGTVTANLRLDEMPIKVDVKGVKVDTNRQKLGIMCGNKVRVGINCSFMPGIKIGGNSVVGPGVLLAEDLEENKFVKLADMNGNGGRLKVVENTGKIPENRDELLNKMNAKK
jgi:bifunctional UDP-N-acetylglucosamine pyrophosphorylase/glucosamine-1-phosphate N-acetyltransferase